MLHGGLQSSFMRRPTASELGGIPVFGACEGRGARASELKPRDRIRTPLTPLIPVYCNALPEASATHAYRTAWQRTIAHAICTAEGSLLREAPSCSLLRDPRGSRVSYPYLHPDSTSWPSRHTRPIAPLPLSLLLFRHRLTLSLYHIIAWRQCEHSH